MFDNASLASALDLVGPQLRLVRKERGVTLAGLAESTGISKSTLSRLETGNAAQASSCCCRWLRRAGCRWMLGGRTGGR